MTHSYTYTHTRYWTDESPGMDKLHEAFKEIESDFLRRSEHIDAKTRTAMEKRLEALRTAWFFMLEEVP